MLFIRVSIRAQKKCRCNVQLTKVLEQNFCLATVNTGISFGNWHFVWTHLGRIFQPGSVSCGWGHSSWSCSVAAHKLSPRRWPGRAAGTCGRGAAVPAAAVSACASRGRLWDLRTRPDRPPFPPAPVAAGAAGESKTMLQNYSLAVNGSSRDEEQMRDIRNSPCLACWWLSLPLGQWGKVVNCWAWRLYSVVEHLHQPCPFVALHLGIDQTDYCHLPCPSAKQERQDNNEEQKTQATEKKDGHVRNLGPVYTWY